MKNYAKTLTINGKNYTAEGGFYYLPTEDNRPQIFNTDCILITGYDINTALENTANKIGTIQINTEKLFPKQCELIARHFAQGSTILINDHNIEDFGAKRYFKRYYNKWFTSQAACDYLKKTLPKTFPGIMHPQSAQLYYNKWLQAFKTNHQSKACNNKTFHSVYKALIKCLYDGGTYVTVETDCISAQPMEICRSTAFKSYTKLSDKAPVQTPFLQDNIETYNELQLKNYFSVKYTDDDIVKLTKKCNPYAGADFYKDIVFQTLPNKYEFEKDGKHIEGFSHYIANVTDEVFNWEDNARGVGNNGPATYKTDVKHIINTDKVAEKVLVTNWLQEHDMYDTLNYVKCPHCGKLITIVEGDCVCGLHLAKDTISALLAGRATEEDLLNDDTLTYFGTNEDDINASFWDIEDKLYNFDIEDENLESEEL